MAEIGSVPCVIGGGWNVGPSEAEHHWDRRQAMLLEVGVKASPRAPTWGAEGVVVPGTDHVGVWARIEAVDADTLGTRTEEPPAIPPEAMETAQGEAWWQTIEAAIGEPPKEWELWTNAAEEGLWSNLGLTRQGGAYRGGTIRYKSQALSRP